MAIENNPLQSKLTDLGNKCPWFVKQELFEPHEPNICNMVCTCLLCYQSSFLENIPLNKQRRFTESWYLAVGHNFVLFSQSKSKIKWSIWYWVRQNDRYIWISRRVYCKLSKWWQFVSNVGSILFSVTDILKPNIRGTMYALAGEFGRPTDIGRCKGLHLEKKKKKQLTIPLVLSQAIALETFERRLQLVQSRSAARKWWYYSVHIHLFKNLWKIFRTAACIRRGSSHFHFGNSLNLLPDDFLDDLKSL